MAETTEALAITPASISQRYLASVDPAYIGRLAEIGNPDKLERLFDALADGNYRIAACQAAGIGQRTFNRWLEMGEADPDSAYGQFAQAVKQAEAAAEAAIVKRVRAAAELPQFWAAGMTLLERKYPDRWGRRTDDGNTPKVVVQIGVQGGDVQVATISNEPKRITEQ